MALLLESEAAERLRVSKRTVAALRRAGKLAYLKGRPVRIDERDLNDYIERAWAEIPPHRFIGPPKREAAHHEMMRRIEMNAFRRQQAREIKAKAVKSRV